jgi:hypothetical protein
MVPQDRVLLPNLTSPSGRQSRPPAKPVDSAKLRLYPLYPCHAVGDGALHTNVNSATAKNRDALPVSPAGVTVNMLVTPWRPRLQP